MQLLGPKKEKSHQLPPLSDFPKPVLKRHAHEPQNLSREGYLKALADCFVDLGHDTLAEVYDVESRRVIFSQKRGMFGVDFAYPLASDRIEHVYISGLNFDETSQVLQQTLGDGFFQDDCKGCSIVGAELLLVVEHFCHQF